MKLKIVIVYSKEASLTQQSDESISLKLDICLTLVAYSVKREVIKLLSSDRRTRDHIYHFETCGRQVSSMLVVRWLRNPYYRLGPLSNCRQYTLQPLKKNTSVSRHEEDSMYESGRQLNGFLHYSHACFLREHLSTARYKRNKRRQIKLMLLEKQLVYNNVWSRDGTKSNVELQRQPRFQYAILHVRMI